MARKINNTVTDALFLVGGGVLGADVALLLAPHSGRETRREIVRFGKKLESNSDKAIHEFADSITNFADSVGDKAVGIVRNGETRTKKARKGILNAIETGQETLELQKRRVARIIG